MKHEPQIQQRAAQPYVGIQMPVTMEGLAEPVDTGFPEVFGWLAKHGVTPARPPFIRYLVIDMETELEIELAVRLEEKWRVMAVSAPMSSRPAGT